jgi:tetratricopeptide (TPR) repeat protein
VNYEWDWSGAEREYKRALELNPNYAAAHQWYAWELLLQGRFDEAIAEMNRARELDPLSLAINTDIGLHCFYMHHFDQAIDQYRKVLEMDPQSAQLHSYMASAYVYDGRYEEALAEQEKWAAFSNGSAELLAKRREQVSEMKRAFAAGGEGGAWRKSLEIARNTPGSGPAGMAVYYAVLGEKDRALQLLEESYVEREELMLYLKVDPGYDNLRSDPRFDNLMRRVGLNP